MRWRLSNIRHFWEKAILSLDIMCYRFTQKRSCIWHSISNKFVWCCLFCMKLYIRAETEFLKSQIYVCFLWWIWRAECWEFVWCCLFLHDAAYKVWRENLFVKSQLYVCFLWWISRADFAKKKCEFCCLSYPMPDIVWLFSFVLILESPFSRHFT